jgi:hypothetical protein
MKLYSEYLTRKGQYEEVAVDETTILKGLLNNRDVYMEVINCSHEWCQ